ncbi:hypothetical protein [Saccharopolyspora spinosa]|nr:hypothetical protein [Saccharopolyspora spinosa]
MSGLLAASNRDQLTDALELLQSNAAFGALGDGRTGQPVTRSLTAYDH